MIFNIDGHYYIIDEDRFLTMSKEFEDNPSILRSWIKDNGILINGDDYLILERDEVEALMSELDNTYINKENDMYTFVIGKMAGFLSRKGKEDARKSKDN